MTEHPTAQWTAQQMVETFPWDPAPRYLLRDRDKIFGAIFRHRVHTLDMREVLIAPRSPWQNPFVERLIGSIRRECLDHVIVFNEHHLKKLLRDYFVYYHTARTHLALDKQCPEPRMIELSDQGGSSPSRTLAACITSIGALPEIQSGRSDTDTPRYALSQPTAHLD